MRNDDGYLPAVNLLKAEILERDLNAFWRFAEERVLTAGRRRVVLRVVRREEPAGDARSRAVEVVSALRTPASTASHHLKLTYLAIIIIIIIIISLSRHNTACHVLYNEKYFIQAIIAGTTPTLLRIHCEFSTVTVELTHPAPTL